MLVRSNRSCWSWNGDHSHEDLASSVHTCQRHRAEEETIREANRRLRHFLEQVRKIALVKKPHLDMYKEFVESPVRRLVSSYVAGWELASAFRPGRDDADTAQLDCVALRAEWNCRLSAQVLNTDEPVDAHVEVTYSAKVSGKQKRKFAQDIARLDRSILLAQGDRRKCWTALVLVGDGWRDVVPEIGSWLHEHYHTRDLVPYSLDAGRPTLPFVDLIATPSGAFVKHNYHLDKVRGARMLPGYGWVKSSPMYDELADVRPILTATGFLNRFLRTLDDARALDEPALPRELWSAFIGPSSELGIDPNQVAVLLEHVPEHLRTVWYARDRWESSYHPLMLDQDAKCSASMPFILRESSILIPVEATRPIP